MKRIAIFVEGQTELIVAREFLLKYFDYSNIHIECRTLFTDSKFHKAEYDTINTAADYGFQIINVGNDNAVLSRMLNREEYLWNAGFEKIICLRDMYSSNYKDFASEISNEITLRFKETIGNTIASRALKPEQISFCFAIMETEAWFLAVEDIFVEIDLSLTNDFIQEKLNCNLIAIDPERKIFHPTKLIEEIYSLVGKNYNKSKRGIESLASKCTKEKFENLNSSLKCESFSVFYSEIVKVTSE